MLEVAFSRGDSVIYQDKDRVQWGPWEVVAVQDNQATVLIGRQVSYAVPIGSLQKVGQKAAIG